MCGIVAYNGPKDKPFNFDKIKLLLMWNQERGKDSLGFYTPAIGIVKDTGKAEDHMTKKDFNIPVNNTFIGHVRAATVGTVNKNNAHPFNYGNIVLAMNGTLSNAWDLCRKYQLPLQDFDVDSQVLTAILNKLQNKSILSEILGGCAIVYTDTNTGKIYCYRNLDRPLYRGTINGGMYISSIENSLKVIGCNDTKEFKQDTLYEIENGVVKNTFKVKRAVTPTITNNSNVTNDETGVYQNVRFFELKPIELLGKWLTLKNQAHYMSYNVYDKHLQKGFGYEVVPTKEGTVNHQQAEYMITVINDLNEPVVVSKFAFEERFPVITIGDYVFATDDIAYREIKDGQFAYNNDLLLILSKTKAGAYVCKNIITEKECIIGDDLFRFAYPAEVREYKLRNYLTDRNTILLPAGKTDENKPVKVEVLTEIQVFEKEVEKTEFKNIDELVEFTLNSIDEVISDLKEIELSSAVANKVKKLEILVNNYTDKHLQII